MEITKGNSTYEGVIEIDGNLACSKCKTVNPKGNLSCHMDFTDRFMNSYTCECGNGMSVTTMRDKKSREMWGN